MNNLTRLLIFGLVFSYLNELAAAQQFLPTVDAVADILDAGGPVLDETDTVISIQQILFADIDRRGILEYDVSSIPENSLIENASIVFHLQSFTSNANDGGPNLRIFSYAGNGIAEIADSTGDFPLVAIGDDVAELGLYEIPLDAILVQSVLDEGTGYLGFQLQGSVDFQQFGFYTNEDASGLHAPATLSLTVTSVPEPSGALAGLAFLLGLFVKRRRPEVHPLEQPTWFS